MLAIALSLGAACCWGIADFLAGLASRRIPVPVVLLCVELGGLVVVGAITLATGEPLPGTRGILLALGCGFAGISALGCFYAALATGTMSIVAPIGATGVALPVIVGIAGGDRPSMVAAAGLAVAAAGCVLAAREGGEAVSADAHRRSIALAAVAAVGFGLFFVLFDEATAESELWTLTLLRAVALPAVAPLAYIAVRRAAAAPSVRSVLPLLAVGVIDMTATGLLALATQRGDLSTVSVLGSLYPVMTVILAAAVLHERLRAVQLSGVALALVGVVMIAAG